MQINSPCLESTEVEVKKKNGDDLIRCVERRGKEEKLRKEEHLFSCQREIGMRSRAAV